MSNVLNDNEKKRTFNDELKKNFGSEKGPIFARMTKQ
jgi:hypothetical protein